MPSVQLRGRARRGRSSPSLTPLATCGTNRETSSPDPARKTAVLADSIDLDAPGSRPDALGPEHYPRARSHERPPDEAGGHQSSPDVPRWFGSRGLPGPHQRDGDAVFVAGVGEIETAPDVVGAWGARMMQKSILHSVRAAKGIPGVPSYSEYVEDA